MFAAHWLLPALIVGSVCTAVIPTWGCGGDSGDSVDAGPVADAVPPVTGNWFVPTSNMTWQWQLVGSVNTSYAVDVYDIDLFNVSASEIASLQATGKKVICYFSAGSYEPFRSDAGSFSESILGKVLIGFEDEKWLDIRDAGLLDIMAARLDLAVQKGCDGVEPDNMDGYQNDSGFPLRDEDQLAFNRAIANLAHTRGLAVGLKNAWTRFHSCSHTTISA
ncbi:MAG: endo alpha-1,4 polygalactosaminidase [Kofleriaceae bacterium]|nr:endo alpha-1,4 polygalactosaminidase [Kofleriaceae bacterium]